MPLPAHTAPAAQGIERKSAPDPPQGPGGAGVAGAAPPPRPPPHRRLGSPRGGRSSSRLLGRRDAVPASPGPPRTHPPGPPGAFSPAPGPVPRGGPHLRAALGPGPRGRTGPGDGRDRLMLPRSLRSRAGGDAAARHGQPGGAAGAGVGAAAAVPARSSLGGAGATEAPGSSPACKRLPGPGEPPVRCPVSAGRQMPCPRGAGLKSRRDKLGSTAHLTW